MTTLVRENWLNAATTTQVTDVIEVPGSTRYAIQAFSTGGASVTLKFEVSLDGANWLALTPNISAGGTPVIQWFTDMPVRFIRLNLTALSGGSSPTVTAHVLAT